MEIPSNSFKIRKSFNMVSASPQVIKTTLCPFYGKHGFCNNTHNLIHQDCKNYFKYQYCFQKLVNKCPYFHREICSNWKKNGKCPIPECEFLHKNCENFQNYKICKRIDCPFFHCANQEKIKNGSNVFVRKSSNIRVTQKFDKSQNGKKLTIKPSQNQIKSENQINNIDQEEKSPANAPKKLMSFNQATNSPNTNLDSLHFRNVSNIPPQENSSIIEKVEISNNDEASNSNTSEEEEEKKAEIFHEEEKYNRPSPALLRRNDENLLSNIQRKPEVPRSPNLINLNNSRNARIDSLSRRLDSIRNASEDPPRIPIERHGNLTIITLNRTNTNENNEAINYPHGTIGHTLDRINQFSQHLRNIRDSLQNQEVDLNFLNHRFRSLLEIQDRLNFVQRQERIIGNLDSLIETFLLINTISNNTQSVGLRLEEFEKIPIFLFGVDDKMKKESNYEDSSTRKMCAICLEDYKENDLVRRLYCSHQYHEDCLREWTKKKINCPVCKKNMKEDIESNSNN